jgi:hypothetical protein
MTKPTQAQVKKIMMGMKDKKPVKVILKENHVGEDGQYPLLLSDTQLNKLNKAHGAGLGCGLTLGKKQLQESMNLSRTMGQGWIKSLWNVFKSPAKSAAKSALSAYISPVGAEAVTEESSNIIDSAVNWLDKKLSPKKKYTKAEKAAILKKEKIRHAKEVALMEKRIAETMSKRRAARASASKAAKVSDAAQLGPAQLDDEGEMNKLEDEDVEPQQSGVFIPSGTGGIIPFGGMMQYEECECPHCEGSGFILNALTRAVQKNLMPRRQGPPPRMMRGMPNRQPRRGGELSAPGREAGPTQLY